MIPAHELFPTLYERAEGRCECSLGRCSHHPGFHRCPNRLIENNWQLHYSARIAPGRMDNLAAFCPACSMSARVSSPAA